MPFKATREVSTSQQRRVQWHKSRQNIYLEDAIYKDDVVQLGIPGEDTVSKVERERDTRYRVDRLLRSFRVSKNSTM